MDEGIYLLFVNDNENKENHEKQVFNNEESEVNNSLLSDDTAYIESDEDLSQSTDFKTESNPKKSKNESNIPIDINIGKLQDWLISRRHVNKDWQKNIIAVREKINNAIQDMPAHDGIASLLSGSFINYFHCVKIIEILKETEADTKNLFGSYGSKRMKDWQEVVKSYEKDNIYLAEAAQIFVRNINYEIPSLKKQIAKEEQTEVECEKKHADYLKNEASCKSEFLVLCKQLGIKGDKIKRELVERLQELPNIYDKIGKSIKPIKPAIEFYSAFTKYVLREQAIERLPLLYYVAQHGNTTVYEWTYGEAPLSVEPDPIHIVVEDEQGLGDGEKIDFGDNVIDFGADAPVEIDFGDGDANKEIDWGNLDTVPADVDLSADISSVSLEGAGIVLEGAGVRGGVARGEDALSVLDHTRTRNQLIDQLVELESFLEMRLYEITGYDDGRGFYLEEQPPTESDDVLKAMLASVHSITSALLAPEITHLHNVKHSPRYVDVLTAQLQQKLALCSKLSRLAEREKERGATARARGVELRPGHARLLQRTGELQGQLESEISKKYKGRPVNIIGGVKFL